jgi:transcriptional regulator with XRE-family HTH domain
VTTEGRRPIRDDERPYLLAMGAALRAARVDAGLPVSQLSERCGVDRWHLDDLERGRRRTRASTLERICGALTAGDSERDQLHAQLVALAGPGLAPESQYADRIARRRLRREAKKLQEARRKEADPTYWLLRRG